MAETHRNWIVFSPNPEPKPQKLGLMFLAHSQLTFVGILSKQGLLHVFDSNFVTATFGYYPSRVVPTCHAVWKTFSHWLRG